jgi:hypothetical protein
MLLDNVRQGVALSGKGAGLDQEGIDRIALAISKQALTYARSREVLALSDDGDEAVHYNLFKAITAASAALGAVVSMTVRLTVLPTLAAIGALGALQGLRESLPRASAQIASLLFAQDKKILSRQALLDSFKEQYVGPPEEMVRDFENGLKALDRVKSIRDESGTVRLLELIVLRF